MEIKPRLLTYAACREADSAAILAGLPAMQLMGTAAAQSASRILDLNPDHVHIVCGKGNNGGDGWALAWMLMGAGCSNLTLYADEEPVSQEAKAYARLVQSTGNVRHFEELKARAGEWIVEALLGSGQKGSPAGHAARALELIGNAQAAGALVLALDVPAGLVEEAAVDWRDIPLADSVHSYGAGKLAAALEPRLAGRVQILPIGFPPPQKPAAGADSAAAKPVRLGDIHRADVQILRKRPLDHKYSAGSAVIIAGDEGMEGAAILAARSFFAAGGGIAQVLTFSENARRAILGADASLLTGLVDETPKGTAVLAGPGIRLTEDSASRICELLARMPPDTAVILDAACCELVRDARYPPLLKARTILTPHHGEWKRTGGAVPDCVHGFEKAAAHAELLGARVLIKGPVSVLFEAESSLVLPAPEPALAAAGSGDCLAGILLAALARGLHFEKAVLVSMGLLHRAAARRVHPEASDFPDLLRSVLSGIA